MNLREAAAQALEALEVWRDSLSDDSAIPGWRFSVVGERAIADLRDALYEDAMQRFTDVQQQMDRSADTGKTSDAPETNFGDMSQVFDSTEADHIPDAGKMVASVREDRTVEPVAYVTGYSKGYATVQPVDPCLLMCVGMALYRSPPANQNYLNGYCVGRTDLLAEQAKTETVEPVAYIHETGFLVRNPAATLTAGMKLYSAPPKREPLTDEEIESAVCGAYVEKTLTRYDITIARAIERAIWEKNGG